MKNPGQPPEGNFFAGPWKTSVSRLVPPSEEYLPLAVHNLFPGQVVPFEVLVRSKIAGQTGDQFKRCCSPGQAFESGWLQKLQDAGVKRVYCHRQDQNLVFSYLNQNLPRLLRDGDLTAKEKAERVMDVTHLWLNQFFTHFETQAAQHLKQGFEYVDHLLDCFRQDHYQRQWVLDMCRYDQGLYSHCLNTSLLSMAFARHLGWEDQKIRELGQGALLHDIGMTRIPAQILNKKGKLADEDWELVKKHPKTGYLMLKTLSLMTRGSLFLVLQHHENGDGSGYPDGLKLAKIHLFARVMRIIDSFEAQISPRSWRPPNPPAKALWTMRQDWQQSGMFDAGILIEFIKFVAAEQQPENHEVRPRTGSLKTERL
jgi:putative nucleotidyltransferase with HDIG domain